MEGETEEMIRKIAITGPESTGKSMLARQLAAHYHTRWVPEYAREYLEQLDRPYHENDLLTIAHGQMEQEESIMPQTGDFLFCDTELLVVKIWSDVKYGRCHPWIIEHLKKPRYSLYLLCDIDLPWEYDPLREHPDHRQFLYDLYYNELKNRQFPFYVVSGTGSDRVTNAIEIIQRFFFNSGQISDI
jgi:NadR type nicotinamide-nucleotide adenylyltransferase